MTSSHFDQHWFVKRNLCSLFLWAKQEWLLMLSPNPVPRLVQTVIYSTNRFWSFKPPISMFLWKFEQAQSQSKVHRASMKTKQNNTFAWERSLTKHRKKHDTLHFDIKQIKNKDKTRDATIPFFQIRSDPENSEYRPIPIRSDPSAGFFFFINVEFLYFCVTLLCVKHNLLDNFILMKNNMKIYIGAVYIWSLHAFCNINPISQTLQEEVWATFQTNWTCVNASGCWNHICEFYSSQNVKIINMRDRVIGYMTF